MPGTVIFIIWLVGVSLGFGWAGYFFSVRDEAQLFACIAALLWPFMLLVVVVFALPLAAYMLASYLRRFRK